MFKFVLLFAALLALAAAKPKPLVLEYDYPVAAYSAPLAAYSAPVGYSYSTYDYALPYSAYAYAPYSYYVR